MILSMENVREYYSMHSTIYRDSYFSWVFNITREVGNFVNLSNN